MISGVKLEYDQTWFCSRSSIDRLRLGTPRTYAEIFFTPIHMRAMPLRFIAPTSMACSLLLRGIAKDMLALVQCSSASLKFIGVWMSSSPDPNFSGGRVGPGLVLTVAVLSAMDSVETVERLPFTSSFLSEDPNRR